jgi:hypothetical protein
VGGIFFSPLRHGRQRAIPEYCPCQGMFPSWLDVFLHALECSLSGAGPQVGDKLLIDRYEANKVVESQKQVPQPPLEQERVAAAPAPPY